ncbi:MAG: beta-lactamase family protein [Chloroflexi bacterium]|nr:beta-lactamase family protein [Chloroflexota bacterium]MBP7042516.1 beta-lactamase family protein [Chloroflexota bacterium]
MIKQLILSLSLLVLLLSGCTTAAQDDPQASPPDVVTQAQAEMDDATAQNDTHLFPQAFPPDVAAQIQAEMDGLTAGELLPGMIVWIDAPEYRFAGASGFANLTNDTPMPPEGAFRIGSITKMFTATVILQLAEEGVLSLDDPLAKWLPQVAEQLPYGDQITLRHLLSHTSGLFNVVEHEAYYADLFTDMVVDEETGSVTLDCVQRDPHDTLARYVYGKDANFEPGVRYSYSNTNYTLLGMVIEAAAEMPLAEAYRTHIYEPLGMASTFLDCYEEPLMDVVHGYTGTGDAMTDITELHESVGWSAGGLVSTAADLVAFARGLFGGALFDDPETLAAMTTPALGSSYGLGVMLQGDYVGHAGYIAGFRSVLNYAPESDTVVVMLYNHDAADPEQSLADVVNPALSLPDVAE